MTNFQTIIKPKENKRVINLTDNRELKLSHPLTPLVMGVLNVTPDSFSDGGKFSDIDKAADHALMMLDQGADIIDIGGESSRPGASPITADQEKRRVLPVIDKIRKRSNACLSIDTYHASTARDALDIGVDIINDISALRFDLDMVSLLSKWKVPVILMHMLGTPKNMQENPIYNDCTTELIKFFDERIKFCQKNGIDKSRLILDPGIGFGKRLSDNLDILSQLRRFKCFNIPLLIGASRKAFIGMLNPKSKKAENRLGGSIATAIMAASNGADILRVHDVHQTVEALKVTKSIIAAGNQAHKGI